LRLGDSGALRVCSKIPTQSSSGTELDLEIRNIGGTALLTNVMLYDHIQQGGLYQFDGKEGVLLAPIRKLNRHFVQQPVSGECRAVQPAAPVP
jgi:hypothetical protein